MSGPYGKKDRITIVWEDAHKSSKINLVKCRVSFQGSQKYCAEQAIRWMYDKGFIDPVGICLLAARLDFTLFGRIWKSVEEEKQRVIVESKPGVLGKTLP